jgi:hypothetical protein
MTDRKTYHVTKTDEGWQGKVEGGIKPQQLVQPRQR